MIGADPRNEGTTDQLRQPSQFLWLAALGAAFRKVRRGMLIFADGVNFNPSGMGEGIYTYLDFDQRYHPVALGSVGAVFDWQSHMMSVVPDRVVAFNSAGGGSFANLSVDTASPHRVGVVQLISGSGAAEFASVNSASQVNLNVGVWSYRTYVSIPTLSNGTNRFTVTLGLPDDFTGTPTRGMYFSYADNVNGGRWLCHYGDFSTHTSTDSGVNVTTAWTKLEISYDTRRASVPLRFYINDSQVAGVTPTFSAAGSSVLFGGSVRRDLGSGGVLRLDWMQTRGMLGANQP